MIFIALAIISFQLQRMKKNKDDVELLYDQLRKQHYALDEARLQLMDYARKVENIAQTEERNRISHDLHDDLGHKLIRLKMMMEASLSILPSQPSKGTDMLGSVRDQLGESMELLRSTVRGLKPDEHSLQSYTLSKLIDGLTRENGITLISIFKECPMICTLVWSSFSTAMRRKPSPMPFDMALPPTFTSRYNMQPIK